ncbi:MAG: HAD family hydrolase, partial [Leptospiraceae bacterium]|nr:HAD family hydrolase [Leptospiraceae bacterium]
VVTAEPISAGMDLLKRAQELGIDCHIVSGTPETELKRIVEQRAMGSMFMSINGSPRPKTQILSELISKHGYRPESCVMVGDAPTDFHAAQSAGIWFIGFPVQAGSYSSLW